MYLEDRTCGAVAHWLKSAEHRAAGWG